MCLGKNSKEKTEKRTSNESYDSVRLTDMNKMIKNYDKMSKSSSDSGVPDNNKFSSFKNRLLNLSVNHHIGGDEKHKNLRVLETSDSGFYENDSLRPIPGRSSGSYDPKRNITNNDTNDLEVEVFKGDSEKASADNAEENNEPNKDLFQFNNKSSENDAIFKKLNIKSPNIETDVSEFNQQSTSKNSQDNNENEENNVKERSTNVNKGDSETSSMLQYVKNSRKHKSKSKDKDKSNKRATAENDKDKKRGKSSKKSKKRKKIKKPKKLGSSNSISESSSSESIGIQKDKEERRRKSKTKASSSNKSDFHPISIPKVNSITSVSSDTASTTSSSSMGSSSNSSIKSSSSENSVKRKKIKPKKMKPKKVKPKKAKSRRRKQAGKGPLNSIYFVIINSIPKCSDTIKQNFEIPYMLKSKTRDSIIPIIQVPDSPMTQKAECNCRENIKYLKNNCESTSSSCCSRIMPKFKVTGFYPDYNNTSCTCSQFDCDNETNLI